MESVTPPIWWHLTFASETNVSISSSSSQAQRLQTAPARQVRGLLGRERLIRVVLGALSVHQKPLNYRLPVARLARGMASCATIARCGRTLG
jgi:hypothetical protein